MRRKILAGLGAPAFVIAGFSAFASAQVTPPQSVESAPLATDPFSTGTLTAADGALPSTLWRGAEPRTLEFLLENLPARPSTPALGEAMRRTLLSPGDAPVRAEASLGGKKLLALARAGFVDEAATVASLSDAGRGDPWTNQAEAVSDLLSGDVQNACSRGQRLSEGRDNPFWVKLRVLCYAEAGERDAADLSLGILRDQFGLTDEEDVFLTAVAAGAAPKSPPTATTPLTYAAARSLDLPFAPGLLSKADGGVLVAVARDPSADPAARIAAAERAAAMGVMSAASLSALMDSIDFDVAAIAAAEQTAAERPGDPLVDALLYQSVKEMAAPEFIRDKAQRIAQALSLADSFHRAYALSILYAEEIAALEGTIVAPQEAAAFATARMAVGDSVGAGGWLSAMIGPDASIGALPEEQAMTFIELLNLLALLDPQSAAQIARSADVSLLNGSAPPPGPGSADVSPEITAHILEAAFDAALENKTGQAGLAALAASRGGAGPADAVIVRQSLKAAGMGDLERRYHFERAWSALFPAAEAAGAEAKGVSPAAAADSGFGPSLKPRGD